MSVQPNASITTAWHLVTEVCNENYLPLPLDVEHRSLALPGDFVLFGVRSRKRIELLEFFLASSGKSV